MRTKELGFARTSKPFHLLNNLSLGITPTLAFAESFHSSNIDLFTRKVLTDLVAIPRQCDVRLKSDQYQKLVDEIRTSNMRMYVSVHIAKISNLNVESSLVTFQFNLGIPLKSA